jgi:plasmid stabilization system protein ParE
MIEKIIKTECFRADVEKQFRYYSMKAGLDVADRYLNALRATIEFIADNPFAG